MSGSGSEDGIWAYVLSGLGVGAAVGEGWWRGETGVLQGGVTGLETFITAGGFCSYTLGWHKATHVKHGTFLRVFGLFHGRPTEEGLGWRRCPPETVRTLSSILELKLLFLETVGAQLRTRAVQLSLDLQLQSMESH